jgi:hypothetical protein
MVDGATTCFPPPAPPSAGLAEDQIMGASNPGLYRFAVHGIRSNRNSGPPGQLQMENKVSYLLVKMPISVIRNYAWGTLPGQHVGPRCRVRRSGGV